MSDYNHEEPLVLHVDLNSAFATIEQQARPMLRGRPVAIINRRTEHTAIVTASYEAKALGVKVGMKFIEAARLAPGLIAVESDPNKYRYIYKKLMGILESYSPNVVMKSIDEGVIDFHEVKIEMSMEEIGRDIKRKLRAEVGCAMRCNVGIGTNRFLAKTAAGLHKPDGMDVINGDNLRQVMATLKLTDLTGIAYHNQARLNAVGIYTALEFLDARELTLRKMVFGGVNGTYWYKRLRGWEVDDRIFDMKRVGRQYVLEDKNLNREQIMQRLHTLCESVGLRMRAKGKLARGVYVYVKSRSHRYWHASKLTALPFYSDKTIYLIASRLFALAPDDVIEIGVHCYNLSDEEDSQLSIFYDELIREKQLTGAIDEINSRYGETTIHSADTLGSIELVKQKIPFGSTRHL